MAQNVVCLCIRLVQKYLWFYSVKICCLILEYILKYGYVIHHFNARFSLYFFVNDLLLICLFYIYFRLGK